MTSTGRIKQALWPMIWNDEGDMPCRSLRAMPIAAAIKRLPKRSRAMILGRGVGYTLRAILLSFMNLASSSGYGIYY